MVSVLPMTLDGGAGGKDVDSHHSETKGGRPFHRVKKGGGKISGASRGDTEVQGPFRTLYCPSIAKTQSPVSGGAGTELKGKSRRLCFLVRCIHITLGG